ncbi:hypothetical protein U0070_014145, partial [Myodes glareolus]
MKGPGKEANTTRVTSPPQMLDKLEEADSLLDDIQKDWSDYLEEKPLPLFSKTKDALGASPHLKARFEGSAKLTFNHEKEITHTEAAENEKVEFVPRLIPASAKGLVEEWRH